MCVCKKERERKKKKDTLYLQPHLFEQQQGQKEWVQWDRTLCGTPQVYLLRSMCLVFTRCIFSNPTQS